MIQGISDLQARTESDCHHQAQTGGRKKAQQAEINSGKQADGAYKLGDARHPP